MPYVELPYDRFQIWYYSNLPGDGDARYLDKSKPTIIFMHGVELDGSFFDLQFRDPRLNDHYNLLSLDSRSTGRTRNPLDPNRDAWTEAADVAKVMELLGLPPCHFFVSGLIAAPASQRLAILWPERVLSLTICGAPASHDALWVSDSFQGILNKFVTAVELETLEGAASQVIHYAFGNHLPIDRQDRVVRYWETQYTGTRSPRFYDHNMMIFHRTALGLKELSLITRPVLIIQGTQSPLYSSNEATALQAQLVNAAGGARVHFVEGPFYSYAIPQFADEVNCVFLDFINTPRPAAGGSSGSSSSSVTDDFLQIGLARLASIYGDALILQRDPRLSSSFSRIPLNIRQERVTVLDELMRMCDQKRPYGILDEYGVPLRRFSERPEAQ